MFGSKTFLVRVDKAAMAPRGRAGDYVWIDAGKYALSGRLVAVRDPGHGGDIVARFFVERTVDAGNETDIRGALVLVGGTV